MGTINIIQCSASSQLIAATDKRDRSEPTSSPKPSLDRPPKGPAEGHQANGKLQSMQEEIEASAAIHIIFWHLQ